MSQVHPAETVTDIRGVVCRHGHFFSSVEAARDWAAEHPEGKVLSVGEAFDGVRAACVDLGWARAQRDGDDADEDRNLMPAVPTRSLPRRGA